MSRKYDAITGKPSDTSYLECDLPDFLQASIAQMVQGWERKENDPSYFQWDCDWCNLSSDINVAEVEQLITPEQAWFLREKYLRMERSDDI